MTKSMMIVVCALALAGCTGGTILESINLRDNSYSVDARQRFVVSLPKRKDRIICAEPSPDALVAVAQAASAQANVAGQGGGGVAFSLSESAASIGIRTATIQLLRDGLYRACEAYANGAIDEFGYALILSKIDDVMVSLMGIEGLTRIPPAMQVAISTKGEGSFTGGEGGKTSAKASTETLTAVMKELKVDKHDSAGMQTLGAAIIKLASKDSPGSSSAAACLMWLSQVNYNENAPKHKKMLEWCQGSFNLAKATVNSGILSRFSPVVMCMNWLVGTKKENRDESTQKICEKILIATVEHQNQFLNSLFVPVKGKVN